MNLETLLYAGLRGLLIALIVSGFLWLWRKGERFPFIPTVIVVLAVATMIALGFWQIGRAHQRDAQKAGMIERSALPVMEYQIDDPADEAMVYRKVTLACDRVQSWSTRGGEGIDGGNGWRHIAACVPEARHVVVPIDMGVSARPGTQVDWSGGTVTGLAVHAPDTRTLAERLTGKATATPLMIVSDRPAEGLVATKQPDPRDEVNSSWSYAGQWFLFALTAAVIYILALRKRWRASE